MMTGPSAAPLNEWQNFYVIVGSSAGALTGLQFVVIALVAEARTAAGMLEIRAFGSPTVVHFCSSLLISAIMCAPWKDLWGAAVCLGVLGVAGTAYVLSVIGHARRQTGYKPDFGDWCWYVGLPLASYAGLALASFRLFRHPVSSSFLVAAMAVLLLAIGIHNSWDTVTYIAVEHLSKNQGDQETPK